MGALSPLAVSSADTLEQLQLKLLKAENRLQRERAARLKAEEIAEKGLSDLYEKQRQLALLEMIATAANQSNSVDETMRFALEAICRHTGWGFGNLYVPSPTRSDQLEPSGIWYARDGANLEPFIAETMTTTFRRGEGLPGRVLQSGLPVWIAELSGDTNFRRQSARLTGCSAAFAFPVLVGSQVLGVLEFYHFASVALDEHFLAVLAQIGTQLGRVIERRQAEERLMHDAMHDPLTGLPNRLLFMDRLERAVATHARRPDIAFAVIFVDLDRFKLVNDSLGHAAGDLLLKDIAERFSLSLREQAGSVSASHAITLARLGGDEFTILIEDIGSHSEAIGVARALQERLRQPFVISEQELFSTASIGIALSDAGYTNAADIMRDADLAMYRAKAEGRARIEIFDESLHLEAKRRLTMENDLRGALKRDEFLLHYQPIVQLSSGRVAGFEALLRWQKDGQLTAPSEFIPLAEETGLIVSIGQWVLEQSLRTLARWQRDYPAAHDLTVSVNVSPRQFHEADFVDQVVHAVRAVGLRPQALRLEITESVTVRDAAAAADILHRLREVGVRVSIDDFGTGYSSLSYLHQLPFDTLKIDGSFVAALQSRVQGGQMVQTILDLARNLHLDVVAEGTEAIEQVSMLRDMGCGYAQGYFFSRPIGENDAAALLDAMPH